MNTCPNEKCQGRLLYQGTSSVNGAFIDWYKCLKCLTVHTAEAESAAPLIASTPAGQYIVSDAEHDRLWETGTLIYREEDGREWQVDRISDGCNGEYCLHGSKPIDWYKPCTSASLTLDYTPLLTGDEDTEPLAIVRDEVQS